MSKKWTPLWREAHLQLKMLPPSVLGSGRKSFTSAPNCEEMKHVKADDKVKSLEVKFYPYLVWIAVGF